MLSLVVSSIFGEGEQRTLRPWPECEVLPVVLLRKTLMSSCRWCSVKYWKKSRDKENKGRNCHTLPAQVGETETRKLLESRTIGAPRVRYSQEVAHFDSDDRNLH